MIVTTHQFIAKNPIKKTDKILILGTIHPHDVESFKIPFFYGNRNSIWNILKDAFPDEIPTNYDLDDIQRFLDDRNIAMSDTILRCQRKSNSALDKDLIPELLNTDLIDQIRTSDIIHILCTSSFGKNNAFRLFYESILGLKITREIKESKSVLLPLDIFGRKIIISILLSPSGAANIALSKTIGYKESPYFNGLSTKPVYDYKVSLYTKILKQCIS